LAAWPVTAGIVGKSQGRLRQLDPSLKRKGEVSALTSIEVRTERLRLEIAQLEARYDGVFPPSVYAVLERLRRELAALHRAL
jgi:hypothetical protein